MSKVYLVNGKLVAARFPLTADQATTKYDIAARATLAGLDDGEYRKMPAAQQREVFGAYIFGRKDIMIDTRDQGSVHVRWLGAWEGTHSSYCWETVTFDQVAKRVAGDTTGWNI